MSRLDKPKNESLPSEAIQDYLDLLLTPTTDPANAAPDIYEGRSNSESSLAYSKGAQESVQTHSEPLLDNGVTPQSRPAAGKSSLHSTQVPPASVPEGRSRLSKVAQQLDRAAHERPFAEPVKPLTLNMPLPKVQLSSAAVEPESKVQVPNVVEQSVSPPVVEIEVETVVEPEVAKELTVDEPVIDEPEELVEAEQDVAEANAAVWMENGRPYWAQERFECLLFTVGGLTLAVPLMELGAIYPMTEDLTPLFGQIDWFMGLLTVKEINIRTVNTAKVVMPERYEASMAEGFNYVISINGVDWGLAVDNVSSAVTLEPQDVHWRSERSKRPWLAGTVIEHMCALLDVSQLAAMFLDQDGSNT